MNWQKIKCAALHYAGIQLRGKPPVPACKQAKTYWIGGAQRTVHAGPHAAMVSAGEEYIQSMQSLTYLLSGAHEMTKQELIASASILASDIERSINERETAVNAFLVTLLPA